MPGRKGLLVNVRPPKYLLVFLFFLTTYSLISSEESLSFSEHASFDSIGPTPLAALENSTGSPQIQAGTLIGVASWYSKRDRRIKRRTANGEVFNDSKLTCASWDFPFESYLHVTNLENGKSVVCRVNDRGPARRLNRLVDLTEAGFRAIANPRYGLIHVSISPVTSDKS